jgi:ADP-ribosylglycohydrolase
MSKYTDKVKGSLLAAALGDGLGAFTECMRYGAVDDRFSTLPPSKHRGSLEFTDYTALRLVLYDAILSGEINAWSFANQWRRKVVDPKVFWTSELYVTALLNMGQDPHRVGYGNLIADNAAMASDPFGTLYPCLDEVAALRAFETMGVCQAGIGLEGAMAVAAAVSSSMHVEPRMDDVVHAAGRHVGEDMKARIEKAVTIAKKYEDPRKQLYENMLVEDGTSELVWNDVTAKPPVEMAKRLVDLSVGNDEVSMGISPLEVVPIAIAYAVKGEKNAIKAIKEAAAFGRDSDTISGIAGAILGAYHGAEAFPNGTFNLLPRSLLDRAEEISLSMEPISRKALDTLAGSVKESSALFV